MKTKAEARKNLEKNSKLKAKNFIIKHKKGLIITLGVTVCVFAVPVTIGAIRNSIEENRDYYIAIDDEFTFDCNARYDEDDKTIYCDEQTISGTFSNFDITKLYRVEKIEGNNFTYKVRSSIYKSEYEKENFNIDDFNNEIERSVTIYLKNNYLKKDVLRKKITVRHHLSEADKALIKQKHNDWKIWKEAEDAKTKQEAEKKAEEERKAKEDAEKKAEEERKAKEDAEKRAAEEKSKQEEQQSQQQSTPTSQPTTDTPSIDEIADACWAYGQTWGVPLTDYASTTITKEDNYYRILMWERGGKSTWKCWYNPDNKDVFVEKTR